MNSMMVVVVLLSFSFPRSIAPAESHQIATELTPPTDHTLFVGLLQASIFAVQGVVFWLTLRAIKNQGRVMGGQLEAMQGQLSEMGIQTGVLEKSVIHAERSAEAALLNAKALINAERPWLFISPVGFKLDPSRVNRLDWRIFNRGRTVANVVEVKLRCRKCVGVEKILTVPPEYKLTIDFHSAPIPPDGTLDAWSDIEKEGRNQINPLSGSDMEDIRTRGADLLAYAFVEYRDQFGGVHESRFCYYYAVPFGEFRINLQAPAEYHRCT